jgi:hypothetical protein
LVLVGKFRRNSHAVRESGDLPKPNVTLATGSGAELAISSELPKLSAVAIMSGRDAGRARQATEVLHHLSDFVLKVPSASARIGNLVARVRRYLEAVVLDFVNPALHRTGADAALLGDR